MEFLNKNPEKALFEVKEKLYARLKEVESGIKYCEGLTTPYNEAEASRWETSVNCMMDEKDFLVHLLDVIDFVTHNDVPHFFAFSDEAVYLKKVTAGVFHQGRVGQQLSGEHNPLAAESRYDDVFLHLLTSFRQTGMALTSSVAFVPSLSIAVKVMFSLPVQPVVGLK